MTQSGHWLTSTSDLPVCYVDPHDALSRASGEAMRRREFIIFLGSATALLPIAARAQQPSMPVIGLLTLNDIDVDQLKSIQNGLNKGGYVEGRNLAIVYRSADGQIDRLAALATDLVDRQVSVMLAVGGPIPARSAKANTGTIRIVLSYCCDTVGVASVACF